MTKSFIPLRKVLTFSLVNGVVPCEKAEPLFLRALAIYEQTLGSDHRWTIKVRNYLVTMYSDQGLLEKVEALFRSNKE